MAKDGTVDPQNILEYCRIFGIWDEEMMLRCVKAVEAEVWDHQERQRKAKANSVRRK